MNDLTKLEVFAAYLPYKVRIKFNVKSYIMTGDCLDDMAHSDVILLRPLSALQTPMLHPVTGERIENPAEWIAKQIALRAAVESRKFEDLFSTTGWAAWYYRSYDRLALELHFDIFGAIEKGWAVQI